jgi:hypothetical protein
MKGQLVISSRTVAYPPDSFITSLVVLDTGTFVYATPSSLVLYSAFGELLYSETKEEDALVVAMCALEGGRLVTAKRDKITVWDTEGHKFKIVNTLTHSRNANITCLAALTEDFLAIGDEDGWLVTRSLEGHPGRSVQAHNDSFSKIMKFDSDSFATANYEKIHLWNFSLKIQLRIGVQSVGSLCPVRGGKLLIGTGMGRMLVFHPRESHPEVRGFVGGTGITAVTEMEEHFFVFKLSLSFLGIWNTTTTLFKLLPGKFGAISQIERLKNGNILIVDAEGFFHIYSFTEEMWKKIFLWLLLAHADGGSIISTLPKEAIFHFVEMFATGLLA